MFFIHHRQDEKSALFFSDKIITTGNHHRKYMTAIKYNSEKQQSKKYKRGKKYRRSKNIDIRHGCSVQTDIGTFNEHERLLPHQKEPLSHQPDQTQPESE
jgi:hypothetical protein